MPRFVSEITSGAQFTRSRENGVVADSQVRTFRVMLDQPGEYLDIQSACEIRIGDRHPSNTNIICQSFSAQYDGESRMVIVCTFNYGSEADAASSGGGGDGGGGGGSAPDIRPANWSVSSTLVEVPVHLWKPLGDHPLAGAQKWVAPTNTAGDRYDGLTRMEPMVTFTVEQFESQDPTRHALLAGVINDAEVKIGSFEAPTHSLMFRGVQCRPVVEPWGGSIRRGWTASYEFLYRKGFAGKEDAGGLGDIGWNLGVPQTGLNVKAFSPPGGASQDVFGQPLKHENYKIKEPYALPDNIDDGDRVRGMVLVHEYENGGASQSPCAQPIPINDDGTPRREDADPKVIVYQYQVQDEYDFTKFGLRLQ
jgi:hypothetical protein